MNSRILFRIYRQTNIGSACLVQSAGTFALATLRSSQMSGVPIAKGPCNEDPVPRALASDSGGRSTGISVLHQGAIEIGEKGVRIPDELPYSFPRRVHANEFRNELPTL